MDTKNNDIILTEGDKTGDIMILVRSRKNACYPDIEYVVTKGLYINLTKMTWTFNGQTQNIGSSRYIAQMDRMNVIGVYDSKIKEHRKSMVWDYGELVQSPYIEAD